MKTTERSFRIRLSAVILAGLAGLRAAAATVYVWQDSPGPTPPYTNWATAAHVIQDAIDAAAAGDEVRVTNGVYTTGGRAVTGTITNRVVIDKPITVQSVSGPGATQISESDRCAYVGTNAVLSGFTLIGGHNADLGGGAFCEASAILTNCVITANRAMTGGGVFGGILHKCIVQGNRGDESGGGVANSTLFSCTVSGNDVDLGRGGGAFLSTLYDSVLDGNRALSAGGGASECVLYRCTVSSNSVGEAEGSSGGGTYDCVLSECLVRGNSVTSGWDGCGGGAVGGTLENSTVIHNSVTGYDYAAGGGVYGAQVINSVIRENSATATKSYVYGGGASYSTLRNCLVVGNIVRGELYEPEWGPEADGAGASECELYNCTLTENAFTGEAAGGTSGASGGALYNCIIFDNPNTGGPEVGGSILNTCWLADPRFVNAAGGDYHLAFDSPCIDAGANLTAVLTNDLDGLPRPLDGNGDGVAAFDIGPYEYDPANATIAIVIQPASRTNVVGSSLVLSVTVEGTTPFRYQWFEDEVPVPAATNRTLVLTDVQLTDAGTYQVQVRGAAGTVTSAEAVVTVVPASIPATLAGPEVNPANDHRYYLLAQSTWVEAEAAARALGGHLVTLDSQAEQDWVVGTFGDWGGQEQLLWIGLHDGDPVNNATNPVDRRSEFVWASGEPVSYANWNAGEPNNYRERGEYYVHTLSPNDPTGPGAWVDAWDVNFNGRPLHGVVEIYAGEPPTIVLQPVSRTNVVGSSLMLSVTAEGTAPFSYQWLKDEVPIPAATNRTLVLADVQLTDAGIYQAQVRGAAGTATSTEATVAVVPASIPAPLAGPEVNPANRHHYYLLDQSTWVEAEAAARILGGHLVTMNDQAERDWVFSSFGNWGGQERLLWIGLHDADAANNAIDPANRQAEFAWSSGEPVSYANWETGQPNNYGETGEFYVHMRQPSHAAAGRWNDTRDVDFSVFPFHGVVEQRNGPSEEGLVAHYPLDGHVLDVSGNGHHGTSTGISFQPAQHGLGAFFDGDSSRHVRVDDFPEIRSNLTVAVWFRLPPSGLGGGPLVTRGFSEEEAYTVFVGRDSIGGLLNWASPERLDPIATVSPLNAELFHHVALVYDSDGSQVSLYLDGARKLVVDYSRPLYAQTEPLYLGVSFPGGLEVFQGVLDDVRIYSRALSGDEIAVLSGLTSEPPTITVQPPSRTNVVGSSLMLSVTAEGSEPLLYQWLKDGEELPDATGRTHVLVNLQPTDAGVYQVRVIDSGGVAVSSNAVVTIVPGVEPAVLAGPVINPANGHQYYLLDQSTWVEAEAAAQAMGSHLATVRSQSEQDWVLNQFSLWGGQERLLWIGLHDADPVNNATNSVDRRSEFVWASGEPVSYANWNTSEPNNYRERGEYYVHTLSPNDSIGPGAWADAWDVDFNGRPLHGVVEFYAGEPPAIGLQPVSRTNVVGSSLMLSVTVEGTAPFIYQWFKGSGPLDGATNRTLILTDIQLTEAGIYWVQVRGAAGTATSTEATVAVVPASSPATLAGPEVNPANGHHYYLLDQSTWVEAEAAARTLGGHLVTINNQPEQDWVFSTFGDWGGQERLLWIGLQDADPVNNATNPAVRQAEFAWSSGAPVTYVNWEAGQPNDYGEVGEFYGHMRQLSHAAAGAWNDARDVRFSVFPFHGVVEIEPGPAIVLGPASVAATVGQTVRFDVQASGALPLHYQWQLNKTNLTGATESTLVLTNVQASQAGAYCVVVSGAQGTVTSADAILSVSPVLTSRLMVVSRRGIPGQVIAVWIELISQGTENALGFSLEFDPNLLSVDSVRLGGDAAGGTLQADYSQTNAGRLGLTISLPSGELFPAAPNEVAVVAFSTSRVTNTVVTPIALRDVPVVREVRDQWAAALPATYQDGVMSITSAWPMGPKSILCIRINYPDDPSEPIREVDVYPLFEGANRFYIENSYGATSLLTPTVTPVLTMPHVKEYYSHGFSVVDVWEVAAAAGFYRTNYDVDCIFSVNAGLGNTSNPGTDSIYIVAPSVRSICHELGHVYRVGGHANGWLAHGGSIIGPGREVGGGNPFDTMGSGLGHFNTCFKSHLEWLPPTYVSDITSSGLFRLHAFDVSALTDGFKYALRIDRGDPNFQHQRYYWVELRQGPTRLPSTQNGLLLNWGPDGSPEVGEQVVLLDTTPGYTVGDYEGFQDAALAPGHTFSDNAAGIHITPLRKNATVPESMDVRVNVGSFTNNHRPAVTLIPSITEAATGETVSFSASALDSDGDELAYAWDFGDGRTASDSVLVTQNWASDGEYLVRCAVSDMKGGTASAAALVRIGNPGTFTVSGQITSAGQPLEGVRVYLSPTLSALTSSDGGYTLTGLAPGRYRVLPMKAYCVFSPTSANFEVSSQSVSRVDFVAESTAVPNMAPLISFIAPTEGWTHLSGTSLDLQVDGRDDGSITNVYFYEGTNFLGAGRDGITWTNVPVGRYVLRAVAVDDDGLTASSADVGITVVAEPPTNDDFANRIALSGSSVSVVGHNLAATVEAGEPNPPGFYARNSVWYSWLAPSNGFVAVSVGDSVQVDAMATIYTGSSLNNLLRVAFASRSSCPAVFLAQQGVIYQIAVDSMTTAGTIVLSVHPAHPPVNDNFADRIAISGCPITATGTNVEATLEPGEPVHGHHQGGASVWWTWTAPESGPVTITTEGSGFRTLLGVYTGAGLQGLEFVAGKGFGTASFTAVAGTAYQIAVDGEQRGEITLNIRPANPPANDDFQDRIALGGGTAVTYASNVDATREPGEPWISWTPGGASVWWSWVAPFDGRFVVDADGSGTGLLGIYTGNSVSNLNLVAHQHLGGLTFQATAGATYQIAVDGSGGFTGSIRLRVFPESPGFESVSFLPEGGKRLVLAAEPGRPHVLQASTDLRTWASIATNINYSSSVQFIDPEVSWVPHRFYRSISP